MIVRFGFAEANCSGLWVEVQHPHLGEVTEPPAREHRGFKQLPEVLAVKPVGRIGDPVSKFQSPAGVGGHL